uniref:Uncharacterized protein n=1 Tax=Anguilla anguilla TaxID=7936 RepID=A0A0E9QFT5_ANGAN
MGHQSTRRRDRVSNCCAKFCGNHPGTNRYKVLFQHSSIPEAFGKNS